MKILFLAANPQSTSRLKLDTELREIEEALKMSRQSGEFELIPKWDVRPRDFRRALLEHEPDIVHFSGHGEGKTGLVVIDPSGVEKLAPSEAVAGLFAEFPRIKCVLLNACYSEVQAQAIVQKIDYVIGMQDTIYDKAAIAFSIGFYDGLGYGRNIEKAFNLGKNAILWEYGANSGKTRSRTLIPVDFEQVESQEKLPEHLKPILLKRHSDVAQIIAPPRDNNIQNKQNNLATSNPDSLEEYQARVVGYLADRVLDPIEQFQLATLAKELGISETQANDILQAELDRIEQAKIDYQNVFRQTIEQGYYPFNAKIEQGLKEIQTKLKLLDSEVAEISRPILEQARKKNLVRYQQAFTAAVDREFPLFQSIRQELDQLQQSLNLSSAEVREIEQPIIERKEHEHRIAQELEQEQQRSQTSSTDSIPQSDESIKRGNKSNNISAEENISSRNITSDQEPNNAQPPTVATSSGREVPNRISSTSRSSTSTPTGITRKQFLQWAGWGSGGLIATLVASQIFKGPPSVSVAEPKYIEPTKDGAKFAGLPLWTVEFETVTVNDKGEEVSRSDHQAKFFKEDLGNGVILEMVSISAGEFEMGSPGGEKDRDSDESPQRKVSVPAFFMGRFAVTQSQYKAVIGNNPARFRGDPRPVERISWDEATKFCQKLSDKTGRNYRLPSEAEWEYACRAGTISPFHFGATLTSNLANYDGNFTYQSEPKGKYRQETTEVGSFPPNAFGLYDMHGNVWEWCLDYSHGNYNGAPIDGSAWLDDNDNDYRMLRGGSWLNDPWYCRSAGRGRYNPAQRYNYFGLRVVCSSA
ncbi:MAG: SUMF1/EgtB/PvdO family nonheme iron enzyme [Cyanobacteria bacterium P01_F01_bin.143]